MFAGFMINAWTTATLVAVVAGVVGFFVVLRGSAFPAHAIPKGAFAGAAGASLLGISTLVGLAVFSLLGALAIGILGRRGRNDVVTALALVMMLALGAAFLSQTTQYEPEIYSLLFGEILGVSTSQILPIAALGGVCIAAVAVLYRPLMLTSIVPEIAAAKGVRSYRTEVVFLIIVALATTMTVPVVGALLIFSLMIGPPAAARSLTSRPGLAMALSVVIALITIWAAIAASYLYNWPVGFFVGALAALSYGAGRAWAAWRAARGSREPDDLLNWLRGQAGRQEPAVLDRIGRSGSVCKRRPRAVQGCCVGPPTPDLRVGARRGVGGPRAGERGGDPDSGPAAAGVREFHAGGAGRGAAGRLAGHLGVAAGAGDVRAGRAAAPSAGGVPGLPGAERRVHRAVLAALRVDWPWHEDLRFGGGVQSVPGDASAAVCQGAGRRPRAAPGRAAGADPGGGDGLLPRLRDCY